VKALFADRPFNEKYHLGAVNSINWARILAQTVYYFLAYFNVHKQIPHPESSELQFVVPTGNFGDVLAGYYAKRMGLPMGKLAIATNSNDILTRFWRSGRYEKIDSTQDATSPSEGAQDGKPVDGGVRATWSPAMDILVSSNFERLLWYLAYESSSEASDGARRASAGATVDGWMKSVKSNGRVEVPVEVLELARRDFLAERVSDDQVCDVCVYDPDDKSQGWPCFRRSKQ
jgi:threonine synthase